MSIAQHMAELVTHDAGAAQWIVVRKKPRRDSDDTRCLCIAWKEARSQHSTHGWVSVVFHDETHFLQAWCGVDFGFVGETDAALWTGLLPVGGSLRHGIAHDIVLLGRHRSAIDCVAENAVAAFCPIV